MGMDRQIKKKKWPPRKIITVAASASFVLLMVYLFVFKFSKSTLNVDAERITVSTVEKGPFLEYIPVMGNVMPIYRHMLQTSEGGRVDKIFMEAGTMVKAGDPIIELVNTDLLLNIMWREADFIQQSNQLRQTRLNMEQYKQSLRQQMNSIEATLALERSTYERYAALFKDKLVSEYEYENAKISYESQSRNRDIVAESQKKELAYREEQLNSLEEQLHRMETNLNASKQKLDALVIRAPISGQLTSLNAEIGEFKSPGAPIGQIDDLGAYSIRARIDEHYVTRVEAGKKGEFPLSGRDYQVRVRRVFPEVLNNQFEVDLDFVGEAPTDQLRRGQTLHIKLELGDVSEAILLARGGFYDTTGGNWVYVVDEASNVAVKRDIRLGRYNPAVYEVLEGLEPGEKVITSSYESFGNMERLVLK
jgi:HlyD family secretion protein